MQELSHSHGHTLDPSTQDTPLFGAAVDLAPGEIMPLGVVTDSLDEVYVKPKKRGRVTFWIAGGWLATVIFLAVFTSVAYAPRDVLTGWLATVADVNPVTYLLEASRAAELTGLGWAELWPALVALSALLIVLGTWAVTGLATLGRR